MTKFKRRIFAALLATSMLAGCGTEEGAPVETGNASGETTTVANDRNVTNDQTGESNEETSTTKAVDSAETTVLAEKIVPTDLKPSEGFEFKSNGDGTCTLSKIGNCTDEDIVIPEKSPEGDTITLIAEYALMSLEADSVTLINYNYTVDKYAFEYSEIETLNIIGGSPVINDSAFFSCEDIKTLTFQDCNIELGEYSFMSCGKDTILTFTDCTGYIDKYAFEYGDFESISFSNCDLELDDSSFTSCENVKSLTISDSKITAGEYAFMSLGKSADIEITDSDITLDDYAVEYSSLNTLTISGGTLEMGKSVFSGCEDLTDIIIDCSRVSMEKNAFMSCDDLVNVSICDNGKSDNEIEIGDYTFEYCKRLSNVKIGNGNVKIGSSVFYGCDDDITLTVAGKTYTADAIADGI
ncbi:MAG: leucine-rich repeat domain-containing protein [Bacteroides sp.]|nr:leucine-rich repeat domain-containing protein [Eubacterium sp.]MCM1419317.1 leucine-rich repeat domain-containing protein [Roseburia sp.]MCM1463155.1 leucine-rich repeat domain-containing protein [Bacteroides sp.]